MRHRLLYSESFIIVRYDVIMDVIYASWKGAHTEETIQKGYSKLLESVREHSCKGIIDDHSQISGIWAGSAEWVANKWVPEVFQAGVKYIACIFSNHIFSKRSTEKVLELINSRKV